MNRLAVTPLSRERSAACGQFASVCFRSGVRWVAVQSRTKSAARIA
jgi:hypothetical protein